MTHPSRPRTWALVSLVGYGVPMLLALAIHPAWASLAVPAAGPWSARLFHHTCGTSDAYPGLSLTLALLGAATIALALLGRRRRLARAPLVLWWTTWVVLALGSVVVAFGP